MDKRHRSRFVACVSIPVLLTGCASTQLNYNTVDIAGTIDSVYTRQTLNNLSKFIDYQYATPSQLIISAGTVQTVNTVTPTFTFPFAPSFATTASAVTSAVTRGTTNTLAGASAGLTATNTSQNNYTVAPLNDENTLRNQTVLYQHAVYGVPLKGNYTVQRIFFNNTFYDDPYQLQLPHCVLCAKKQGGFYGEPHPEVYTNPNLPAKWLFWTNDPLEALPPGEDFVDLGHYGNHELYMRRADYSNGVLTKFVLFTLPNTEPAEVFRKVVPARGAHAGAVAPAVPATNMRINPAARQNFNIIIPQQIQP